MIKVVMEIRGWFTFWILLNLSYSLNWSSSVCSYVKLFILIRDPSITPELAVFPVSSLALSHSSSLLWTCRIKVNYVKVSGFSDPFVQVLSGRAESSLPQLILILTDELLELSSSLLEHEPEPEPMALQSRSCQDSSVSLSLPQGSSCEILCWSPQPSL